MTTPAVFTHSMLGTCEIGGTENSARPSAGAQVSHQ